MYDIGCFYPITQLNNIQLVSLCSIIEMNLNILNISIQYLNILIDLVRIISRVVSACSN